MDYLCEVGAVGGVVLGWGVSKISSPYLRWSLAGLGSSVLLTLPSNQPVGSMQTMMKSVAVGLSAIHLMSAAFFPTQDSLLGHTTKYFNHLIPVSWSKKTRKEQVINITKHLFWALVKVLAAPFILQKVNQITASYPDDPSYLQKMIFSMAIGGTVVAFNWSSDLQCALIPLLSLGRLEFLSFTDLVFLSKDFVDFWSRRYNLLIRGFLHGYIFKPLRSLSYSASFSAMMCFVVSGLLHSLVAYYTFDKGVFSSLLFFVLNGFLCSFQVSFTRFVENWIRNTKKPPVFYYLLRIFNFVVFWGLLFCLFPLYLGLWDKNWYHRNPPDIPQFSHQFYHYIQNQLN